MPKTIKYIHVDQSLCKHGKWLLGDDGETCICRKCSFKTTLSDLKDKNYNQK